MKLWRVGVSAVGMLAVVGCVGGEVAPSVSPNAVPSVSTSSTPTPSVIPTPTPRPTPTPTPTPTSFESYPGELPTEDAESAAIIAGWQEYQRVYEKFAMAPNKYTDYTETQYVTTGHESTVIFDRIDGFRDNGLELVGGLVFEDLAVSPPKDRSDGTRTSQLSYCADINSLQIRDVASGELVERSGRLQEIAYMREGLDGVWRVEGLDPTGETC